jgi:3-deoxy-D-manno-octulosonic-acid transferase
MSLNYGIFPKACDHERIAEIGWLLYSTHQQDEECVLDLISNLVKYKLAQNGDQ